MKILRWLQNAPNNSTNWMSKPARSWTERKSSRPISTKWPPAWRLLTRSHSTARSNICWILLKTNRERFSSFKNFATWLKTKLPPPTTCPLTLKSSSNWSKTCRHLPGLTRDRWQPSWTRSASRWSAARGGNLKTLTPRFNTMWWVRSSMTLVKTP